MQRPVSSCRYSESAENSGFCLFAGMFYLDVRGGLDVVFWLLQQMMSLRLAQFSHAWADIGSEARTLSDTDGLM